ncbi:MAG: sugar transferase [Ruminococcus sp.]|nr:sugar transferase [Ruminococcus sp.]
MESSNLAVAEKQQPELQYKKKPVYDAVKRIFDIVVSLCALVVLSPLFLVLSVLVFLGDFGNPFFSQERTGKDGKKFKMYKFRSMHKNAELERIDLSEINEADGPLFKLEHDPRITKVGHFIRRTSLDELPQLVNVLKGDMSVIGPRPFVVFEQDECSDYQQQRLIVKPGLSCYAALDMQTKKDFDYWIELDFKYINERSFKTDLKIIFKTIGVMFKGRNV